MQKSYKSCKSTIVILTFSVDVESREFSSVAQMS